MEPFAAAASRIIKEQQSIIGPLALTQARKVTGLQIQSVDDVIVTGNGKDILTNLVNQYAKIFGQTSIEVCKEAIEPMRDTLPAADVPDILKN